VKNILIFSQDRGGGNIICLVAKFFSKVWDKTNLITIIHPLSEPVFQFHKVPYILTTDTFVSQPVSKDDFIRYFKQNEIFGIICTLSSNLRDQTNSNLIVAAGNIGVKTLGILDHWVGFNRLFSRDGRPELPDILGCIDASSREKLVLMGVNPQKIHITGHAHLERLYMYSKKSKIKKHSLRILLVSQPVVSDTSFRSIFHRKYRPRGFFSAMKKFIDRFGNENLIEVNYRPHPKETMTDDLPEFTRVETSDYMKYNFFNKYDLFIGISSMMMMEAYLNGCECLFLMTRGFGEMDKEKIPYTIGENITHINQLETALENILKRRSCGRDTIPTELETILNGSSRRLIDLCEEFVSNING